jgi:hypothetical protein
MGEMQRGVRVAHLIRPTFIEPADRTNDIEEVVATAR